MVPRDLGVTEEAWDRIYDEFQARWLELKPDPVIRARWDDDPSEPAHRLPECTRRCDILDQWAGLCHWAIRHHLELQIPAEWLVKQAYRPDLMESVLAYHPPEAPVWQGCPGWYGYPSAGLWSAAYKVLEAHWNEQSNAEYDEVGLPCLDDNWDGALAKDIIAKVEFLDPHRDPPLMPPWVRYKGDEPDIDEILRYSWRATVAWAERNDAVHLLPEPWNGEAD